MRLYMAARNPNLEKLTSGYLFPEINKRKRAFLEKNPKADLISLGIGDTTEPLTPVICDALKDAAVGMGTPAGYSGYGDEQGLTELRERIAHRLYENLITPDEVFVSDGAKCDIGRLQILFGSQASVAVQNPAYPVYIDGSVILGASKSFNKATGKYDGIEYMDCTPENNFFPQEETLPKTDLIYFCSPNNPTGAIATKEQLTTLVQHARKHGSIIIFDTAYSSFIRDESLPLSIYEIEGAHECAIETGSFSKMVGFTGLRLGWTIVPKALTFSDGSSVATDWNRIITTLFNGASIVVQKAGIAALSNDGITEMRELTDFYLGNAESIKEVFTARGMTVYGGGNSPYIWVQFPGRDSWDVFSELLEQTHIVCTPGSGFGSAGEGFVRFSAFGHRENVEKAVERLKKHFG